MEFDREKFKTAIRTRLKRNYGKNRARNQARNPETNQDYFLMTASPVVRSRVKTCDASWPVSLGPRSV